jgi:uncharacterized protein (TIGR02300 family)
VTKAELGTKRLCPNCGAKYYDLNHDPIICPRCGTQFEVTTTRARAQPVKAAAVPVAEPEVEAAPAAEFVTLEEADEEAADSGAIKIDVDDDEEVEADDEEDNTFLAEEDEEGDDVTDIIGDVDEEEP